jgi:hypothetical protein
MALSKPLLATDGRSSRHNDDKCWSEWQSHFLKNCILRADNFAMACPNQKRRSENIPVTIATMMQRIRFSHPGFVSIHF